MEFIADEYENLSPLEIRLDTHARFTVPPRDILTDVIEAAEILPTDALLDVGSGTGAFLARLRAEKHTGRLQALDASAAAVEAAGRIDGVESVLGDAQALPFADGEFDVVAARHMLYHLDSPITAIREARRVLRPGGRFVATVNHPGSTAHIVAVLTEAAARHGVPQTVRPNAHVNSANLPALVSEVFGHATVATFTSELVVPDPEPIIAYGLSSLTLFGVPEDGPVRAAVVEDVRTAVFQRFEAEGGVWRDPTGYSVCTAVLS